MKFAVLLFAVTYIYALYNLYIGRHLRKYKIIIIVLNFMLLAGYIMMLGVARTYNEVALIILLLLILAIIVLGIIGSFLFDELKSVNLSRRYQEITRWFSLSVKGVYIITGLLALVTMGFQLLTHELNRPTHISFVLFEPNNQYTTCDTEISFDKDDTAEFFMYCGNTTEILQNYGMKIYINNEIVHEHSERIPITDGHITYDFDYEFEDIIDTHDEISIITVHFEQDDDTIIYTYYLYDYYIDFSTETVPIWVSE